MTAGRPATPLAEKIRRLTGQSEQRTAPLPFEWENPFEQETDEEAWTAWRFVVADCQHRKVLANGDRNEVYRYCVFYQRAMRADEDLNKNGSLYAVTFQGDEKIHPAVKISETSWDRVGKIGAGLGLDPINRNKPLMVTPADLEIAEGTAGAIDLLAFARDRAKPPPWERGEQKPAG